MAGFWNQSQSQLYDPNGKPLVGARAYFYLGGTTTPITVYKAFSLGAINAHPNPLTTDGWGRWPSVYLDEVDQFFRVRVTTASGVMIYDIDGIPIIGPAESGGGGGDNPVNPTAVFATGDIKSSYDTDFKDGWARMNGRTIGSATSGASERANADTQALFEWLWSKNANLVVVGGRGATANADWLANKQITLPDARGGTLIGLDTMGNTAAGIVAAATSLGARGGEEKHTLSTTEMPSHAHGGQTGGALATASAPLLTDLVQNVKGNFSFPTNGQAGFANVPVPLYPHIHAIPAEGGGLGHNNMQPYLAITLYIKL